MKDGYYLSTYLDINELGYLLDLPGRHDQNISLWKKAGDQIRLIHYWELERRTGIKMHRRYFYNKEHAENIINQLLNEYDLSLDDMVEVWGTPLIDKYQTSYHSINEHCNLSYHAISHLFSSIMINTNVFYNETIVALAVDGSPDGVIDSSYVKKPFYVGGISRKGNIDLLPVSSPGILWQYAKEHFHLREGTLMALASACACSLDNYELIEIDMRDINAYQQANSFMESLCSVLEQVKKNHWANVKDYDDRFTEEENLISMAMKVVQSFSLKMMEGNIDKIVEKYGIEPHTSYLALSGGYSLNCPTNSHLMNKYGFKGFLAPPCTSDTGLSLGIALYSFYKRINRIDFYLGHAAYGDRDFELEKTIKQEGYETYIKSIHKFELDQLIQDIQEAPVVWFYGAAEMGPRALGNRSILADPRREESRDRLNEIKCRQWWRPVAPIILENEIENWFDNATPSPFMLQTFKIIKEKSELVPAVAHLDGSARVQTINMRDDQAGLYDILKAFFDETGVPMLCNTSLNDIGEPIINRIGEALNFALRKKIGIVYINKQRVELQNHDLYAITEPAKRSIDWSLFSPEERIELLKELNPHNVSRKSINVLINSNVPAGYIDIKNKRDLRKLEILTEVSDKLHAGFLNIL